MLQRILIPVTGDFVAYRFDLATEIQIITTSNNIIEESKAIVLPYASTEKLCHLIITENAKVVICGGIEDDYYQYLTWKRIQVFDSVIGKWETALDFFIRAILVSGDILDRHKPAF